MLDNFREWLSDNLRYFMLGAAIILILVVLVFGIRAIAKGISGNDSKTKTSDKQVEEDNTGKGDEEEKDKEEPTPTPNPDEAEEDQKDSFSENANPDITTVVTSYYTALQNKDIEGIRKIYDDLSDSDVNDIKNNDKVEGYSDISTYVKAGPAEGTYIVFAEYKIKYKDIDTLAPGLSRLYLYTDDQGELKIQGNIDDKAVNDAIDQVMEEADVQELVSRVNQEYYAAQAADPKLKAFIDEVRGTTSEAAKAEIGATITLAKNCNVRKGPGTNYDAIGSLKAGAQLVKKGSDGDWIQIDLNGQTGYIRSDMFQ